MPGLELEEMTWQELDDAFWAEVLGCWCSPLPCHGDVLVELANPRKGGRTRR